MQCAAGAYLAVHGFTHVAPATKAPTLPGGPFALTPAGLLHYAPYRQKHASALACMPQSSHAFARCLAAAQRAANAASAFSARLAPAGRLPGVAVLACARGGLAGFPGVGAPCAKKACGQHISPPAAIGTPCLRECARKELAGASAWRLIPPMLCTLAIIGQDHRSSFNRVLMGSLDMPRRHMQRASLSTPFLSIACLLPPLQLRSFQTYPFIAALDAAVSAACNLVLRL